MRRRFETPAIVIPAEGYQKPKVVELGAPGTHLTTIGRKYISGWPDRRPFPGHDALIWVDSERAGNRFNQQAFDLGIPGVFGTAVITGPVNETGVIVAPVPDELIQALVPGIERPGVEP